MLKVVKGESARPGGTTCGGEEAVCEEIVKGEWRQQAAVCKESCREAAESGKTAKGNVGKDCKKAKAAARSAKAAVLGKSERCQKRPCEGTAKKTYAAKSGRVREDCKKRMLLNGGRENSLLAVTDVEES